MNDIQLAQILETSDEEEKKLNSKPSPEANMTKNNLFMNLRSGRYESLHGERALIQAFTTNCDHCVKALKNLEAFSESFSDKGTICVALCVRGKIDEARKFVHKPSGNVGYYHAGAFISHKNKKQNTNLCTLCNGKPSFTTKKRHM
jgi:hypothetical protein